MGKMGLVAFLTLLLVICSSNGCRPVPRIHYRPVSVEDVTGQIKWTTSVPGSPASGSGFSPPCRS